MWCKNDNCCYYNKKDNKCTRRGTSESNKNKIGICWMEKSEGEY